MQSSSTQSVVMHKVAHTALGRIHYLECGQGAPLVLLHSNGCSAQEFEHNFERLGAQFRVLAWDMPGHGESDGASGHMSIQFHMAALAAWLDRIGVTRAHLLGTSIGGTIAAGYCAAHPGQVASLQLVETPLRTHAEWLGNWTQVERIFAVPTQSIEQIAPRFKQVSAALLERWNIDRNKAGGWRMVDAMSAIAEFDVAGALARIETPTLLILGDKGPVIDALARYRDLMPAANVLVLDECGHFPMIDDPAAFDAAVIGFAATASAATVSGGSTHERVQTG